MGEPDAGSRLSVAVEAAAVAGRRTLELFQTSGLEVEQKCDGSPVTAADRAAELSLRETIARAFPSDSILGEELDDVEGASGYRWILDPIDGTRSFVQGVPLYGTLVAVEHEGEPVIGVIEMPALDERIYAARGHGAWHVHGRRDPVRARVSSRADLEGTCVCVTDPGLVRAAGVFGVIDALCDLGVVVRGWSDCYAHLLVATGRAEAVIEPEVSLWDVAPMVPILAEAGGAYTDWSGRPDPRSPSGISSNGPIGGRILAMLDAQGHAQRARTG